ncbi:molybdopterin-containing oxidoreductase family protein [Desulfosediminicola flagellatus]|uniref:molybdopterin-containing oxidoreductase family protein n=1 Tax=Desulfosediminicola flagellatus TaxID=2569541 RepID=UPI0010AC513E|nr:molybdopterin-dependent oxidoreductase [Desulfosediminicola flagellatus]
MKQENGIEYKKTICPLDCPDSCGIIAKVDNGTVVSLKGDPDHPYTQGYICRKMRSYIERVYSSERVLYPQLRVGEKGEGKFKRISWDEALEIFARKVTEVRETYGGEAILPYQYAGNMGAINKNAGYALYHKLGASRILETICSAAAGAGMAMHLPDVPGSPPEVAEDADLIVAWGINIKVTNIHFWQYVAAARKRGAKLLVIDPYKNDTVKSADLYIPVQPGGDGALALGAIKLLLESRLIDRQMLEKQTTGFDALEKYLRATPWDEFTRLSGVEKSGIEQFAQLLAGHPKTFIRIGIGLSRNSRGGMSVRSIASLGAVLGLLDGQDGKGMLLSSKSFTGDSSKLRFPELMEKPTRHINMAHLGHALTSLKPPVKMFISYNCNPLCVAPDASIVRKGLERDDLFTVVHEQVMTPTARYADLLLPATTFLENRDLYTGYGHFQFGVVDSVIEPLGEAKSNFQLFQDLAGKLGFTDEPFRQTVDDRLSAYIATIEGLPPNFEFIPDKPTEWITSTRKRLSESVIDCWQTFFAFNVEGDEQTPSIPCLLEADEFSNKDLCSRFPLQLITPPHIDLLNSTFGERYPEESGTVLIHPNDAEIYNITDGCVVKIYNHRGGVNRVAKVTEDTRQGLIVAEGIFWQTASCPAGINDLTSQKTTDIAAGPTFHESLVAITPIDGH